MNKDGDRKKRGRKARPRRAAPAKKKPPGRAVQEEPPGTPMAPPIAAPDRRGQLAVERSRFETGDHRSVLREELGELPPGYGLTVVRGVVRDPRHLVLAWDINDPDQVRRIDTLGWKSVEIHVDGFDGVPVARVAVGRRAGTHHLELPEAGLVVTLALGFVHPDGFFETIARSATVRLPPEAPAGPAERIELATVPEDLDLRELAAAEPPPRPGAPPRRPGSPAGRLAARLGRSAHAAGGDETVRQASVREVGPAGTAAAAPGPPAGGAASDGPAGARDGRYARGGDAPSSESLVRGSGRPPTSPGRHEFGAR